MVAGPHRLMSAAAIAAMAVPAESFADRDGVVMAVRLEKYSRPLLGVPYQRSPLGEGQGQDPDPRIRWDRFDCTTFVETVLAMSRVDSLRPSIETLDAIRYTDGPPTFGRRRHLIASQWLPELIASGVLVDRTRQLYPKAPAARVHLSPGRWKARDWQKTVPLPTSSIPTGQFSIRYVPWPALGRLSTSLPSGLIFSVVRRPSRRRPNLVTHQGLVVENPTGKMVVRHASSWRRKVVEEPLARYLARMRRKKHLLGLNLAAPAPPRPSVASEAR